MPSRISFTKARELIKNSRETMEGYGELTIHHRQIAEEMVLNSVISRREFLSKHSLDNRRDLNKECGFPSSLVKDDYFNLHDRNCIATRVNNVIPKEAWQRLPTIYENDDAEAEKTEFEKAWQQLGRNLQNPLFKSFFVQEEGSIVWEYLKRVDIASGIGTFGLLLFGIDDGKTLDQPVKGFPKDGEPSNLVRQYTRNGKKVTQNLAAVKPSKNGKPPVNGKPTKEATAAPPTSVKPTEEKKEDPFEEVETDRKLLYLRSFSEKYVEVVQIENDRKNARYGKPVMYSITFNDPASLQGAVTGGESRTQRVHWSRVLHVADTILDNENFAVPRMQPVINNLMSLDKLYGGSAEMYWKGAFFGIAAESNPEMGGEDVQIDIPKMRKAMERYMNSLQRFLIGKGLTFKTLAPTVVDPEKQIDVQITAICIYLGIPKRVFMGSERGELASGQDDNTWNDRLKERNFSYTTPRLIVPFVDHCIKLGLLPEPADGFKIEWPDLFTPSAQQVAERAAKLTQAMNQYISGGCDAIMDPITWLEETWGLPAEKAKKIGEKALAALKAANPEADNVALGKQPLPSPDELAFNPADGQPIDQKKFGKPVPGKTKFPKPGGPPKPKAPTKNARRMLQNALGSGANCGTGGGGFKPGNVCAKGKAVVGRIVDKAVRTVDKAQRAAGQGKAYAERKQPKMYSRYPNAKSAKVRAQQEERSARYRAVQRGRFARAAKGIARDSAEDLREVGKKVTDRDVKRAAKRLVDQVIYGKMPKGAKNEAHIEVSGTQGKKNSPFTLTFRNKERFERWKNNNRPNITSVREFKNPAVAKGTLGKRLGNVAKGALGLGAAVGGLYLMNIVNHATNEAARRTIDAVFGGRTDNAKIKGDKRYRVMVDALTNLMIAEFPQEM